MNKKEVLLVIAMSLAVFLIVYSPHFNYRFPYHTDEWHQITEAKKLAQGEYQIMGEEQKGVNRIIIGYELGFHILLLPLYYAFDLVRIYRFLPAIWAALAALVLFYIVRKKTSSFYTALFSMLFFASLKSNVNITGLWFFTPMAFSIPFIFLYVYFFTEGIEKKNKKFILACLAIMAALIFIHAISALFSVPFLLAYALINFKYVAKEYRFFSLFLIIPFLGFLFYLFMAGTSLLGSITRIFSDLQFKYGFGVYEVKNSPFEIYSLAGYILAGIGIALILFSKKARKFYVYLLWPAALLVSIAIFRIFGVSFLSSYQRNIYYFAISLPFLSALGLNYVMEKIKNPNKLFEKTIGIILLIIIFFLVFRSYSVIPGNIALYRAINENDYNALLFLKDLPKSTVMAKPLISEAIYPVSGHNPVATTFFYGNKTDSNRFFNERDCGKKMEILEKYDVKYVLSAGKIECGWQVLYSENDYIYQVR